MLPVEIWLLILDNVALIAWNECNTRSRPVGDIHLRAVCLTFSRHATLRSLAYLFAPPNIFVNDLRLALRFLTATNPSETGFKLSQIVALRTAISTRCGASRFSMDTLYTCVLHNAENMVCKLPLSRRHDFVNFLAYCFSPLAGYMKAYKRNSLLSLTRVREFDGIPELRRDLMRIQRRCADHVHL